MKPAPHSAVSRSPQTASCGWLWALLAFVVCLAAISRQSLWIDEALTAAKASQADLRGWWQAMLADKASDLQMPLYMIYMWGFAKIAGASEWALRAANIPWFVAGIVAFIAALPQSKKLVFALVALASPFAWYYLDEARPYAMQLGASLVIFAALDRLNHHENLSARQERRWIAAFFFGIISLCGSSLLGMIWAGTACLSLPMLLPWQRLGEMARSHCAACLFALGWLVAIGLYYLWTLKLGARASDVGQTDARNVMFIAYELFGLSGLGPGRLEIRANGLRAFVPFAKQLALYGAVIFDLLILGGWQIYRSQTRRRLLSLGAVITLPMLTILGAGLTQHFRVLGRHFTPLLPVVLFILCLGLSARWSRRHWISKPLVFAFVILSVISCVSFRLAARHQKDDYRDAAAYANRALQSGQVVWWNAGREGAVYYQVPITDAPGKKARALWLMNPTPSTLAGLPVPELIVASKPDVYDGRGAAAEYLRQNHYLKLATLPAFTIWQSAAALAEAHTSSSLANLIE